MLEGKLQKKTIDYLNSIGAYVVNVITASESGVPDLLCCYEGKFYGCEQKTIDGVKSKVQEYNIKRIKAAGGVAGFVTTIEDVKRLIGNPKVIKFNKPRKVIHDTFLLKNYFG